MIAMPFSETLERATIGAMMVEARSADLALQDLQTDHFWIEKHRGLFNTIRKMRERKEQADTITVFHECGRVGLEIEAGDLFKMVDDCVTVVSLPTYAKNLRRLYYDREILRLVHDIPESENPMTLIDQLRKVCVQSHGEENADIFDFTKDLHSIIDRLSMCPPERFYLGYPRLDDILNGLEMGDVLTVGGRTSYGKTALMVNVALRMAQAGKSVLYFSGEMSEFQLVQRILPQVSGVPAATIRSGQIRDFGPITTACASLASLCFSVNASPSPTAEQIETASLTTKAQVIFIDYLQRCNMPKADNYRLRVCEFMRRIKNFARTRGAVVILGCQVNRLTDRSKDSPPVLADLRESSAIEDESDQVLLLHADAETRFNPQESRILVTVAKNRHGRTGPVNMVLQKTLMRFEEA